MATAKVTVGQVLETVGTTAAVLTQTVSMVGGVVSMGNRWVQKAQLEQKLKHEADTVLYRKQLKADTLIQYADIERTVLSYAKQSAEHEALMQKAEQDLADLFVEKRTNLHVAME
jgi:hypothetical protein